MTNVVTYRLAYTSDRVDLCAKHEQGYPYPLGPVEKGAHRGTCSVCEHEAHARMKRAIRNAPMK